MGTINDTTSINLKERPNMQMGTEYKGNVPHNGKAIGGVLFSKWKRHAATVGPQKVKINATKSAIKIKNDGHWKDVSKALDVVCFIFFCLVLIALSAVFIIGMSLNIYSFQRKAAKF